MGWRLYIQCSKQNSKTDNKIKNQDIFRAHNSKKKRKKYVLKVDVLLHLQYFFYFKKFFKFIF